MCGNADRYFSSMTNAPRTLYDESARLRVNVLAAALIATLLGVGAFVADELWEASFACYAPEGGCEATGVPAPSSPTFFNH